MVSVANSYNSSQDTIRSPGLRRVLIDNEANASAAAAAAAVLTGAATI